MAHFAKIGAGNIVEKVEVVSNDIAATEQAGINFLNNLYNTPYDIWKQTSFNTLAGEHLLGGTPFRKNFASVGFTYDPVKDAFIPPKYNDSWRLNDEKCIWEAPVAEPVLTEEEIENKSYYKWNEDTRTWDLKQR